MCAAPVITKDVNVSGEIKEYQAKFFKDRVVVTIPLKQKTRWVKHLSTIYNRSLIERLKSKMVLGSNDEVWMMISCYVDDKHLTAMFDEVNDGGS